MAACDVTGGRIELRPQCEVMDARLRALATAVDLERPAGWSGAHLAGKRVTRTVDNPNFRPSPVLKRPHDQSAFAKKSET